MLEKKMAKVDVCENYVSGQPGMPVPPLLIRAKVRGEAGLRLYLHGLCEGVGGSRHFVRIRDISRGAFFLCLIES